MDVANIFFEIGQDGPDAGYLCVSENAEEGVSMTDAVKTPLLTAVLTASGKVNTRSIRTATADVIKFVLDRKDQDRKTGDGSERMWERRKGK